MDTNRPQHGLVARIAYGDLQRRRMRSVRMLSVTNNKAKIEA